MRASTTLAAPDVMDRYLAAFEAADRRRDQPAWLRAVRREAISAFARLGFPGTGHEAWRFTPISPLVEAPLWIDPPAGFVTVPDVSPFVVADLGGPTLVFVDGRFARHLSSQGGAPDGVRVTSLSDAIARDPERLEPHLCQYAAIDGQAFAALNTALFEDGAVVDVAPHAVVDGAIRLVFLATATPTVSHPRVLVLAGRESQVRVVETYASAAGATGLTNAVTEIATGPGASVDYARVQREGESAFHVGLTRFHVRRGASVASHAVAVGGRISRHDAVVVLADEGAACTLDGLYVADGSRLVDNHTEIDHAMPNGTSQELYKGILDGEGRAVFNGRIRVRPDAQRTDARQTSRALLLSDGARINAMPQLEILADDVKCTHGATVGRLSDDALFYLRARGIGREEARTLLIRAFALEVVGRIGFEPVRRELDRLLMARLPGGAGARGLDACCDAML